MLNLEITLERDPLRPGQLKFTLRGGSKKGQGGLYPVIASARMDAEEARDLAWVINSGATDTGISCDVRDTVIA